MRKINKIILHCSATPNGRNDSAKDIHRWHRDRGWSGIGYHYVIKVDGIVENGRPEYWEGAHAYGHNKDSIGICLIGTDSFSDEQMYRLSELVRNLKNKYLPCEIIGHNEISNKICPGFDVKKWLKKVKLI